MGNSQSEEEDEGNSWDSAVCRNMSEYQLSLHDGKHSEIKEVYLSLNGHIFSVTGDEEFISKHEDWVGKNTDKVPEEDVQVYRNKYKHVGEMIETKEFTVVELKEFDGTHDKGIYLAAKTLVFDVTTGEDFYGVDRGYHLFAGRNCQRALALVSLKEEDVVNTDLSNIDDKGMVTLDEWITKYHTKYVHVGYLKEQQQQEEQKQQKSTE